MQNKDLIVNIVRLIRLTQKTKPSDGVLAQEIEKIFNRIKKELKDEIKKELKL